MQTNLLEALSTTPEGKEADAILRSCVHCGFCTATCPTYQILGDELDGPRGRIYLIKQVLEGKPATTKTMTHLDRCLTCRNCESTCPSGVRYGRLVDIGRKMVEDQVQRPLGQRIARTVLKEALSRPWVFKPAIKIGQMVRPMLPEALKNKVPAKTEKSPWPVTQHSRKMLLLDGCVQPSLAPNINAATARVLDALKIQTIVAPKAGCCGAIKYHMNDQDGGLMDMRRNIDAWWPYVEAGVEAIIMTASGCGVTVKEYGHLLEQDPEYAAKAKRISELTRDLSEVLPAMQAELQQAVQGKDLKHITYHPPCTLQHGQKIRGNVEGMLTALGVQVKLCADSHLCCGSAGTYSLLQPDLSYTLRDKKLANLEATNPEMIVTANIGCQTHLQSGTTVPVKHWVELVDQMLHA